MVLSKLFQKMFGSKHDGRTSSNDGISFEIEARSIQEPQTVKAASGVTEVASDMPHQSNGLCPDCQYQFGRPPAGSRKCPSCGSQLTVRKIDGDRLYQTAAQIQAINVEKEVRRKERRAKLRRENNIEWAELQKKNESEFQSCALHGMEMSQFRMATICESEKRFKDAFRHWSCVFMLAINGAARLSSMHESPIWKQGSLDEVNRQCSSIARPIQALASYIDEGVIDIDEAEHIFMESAQQFDRLSPPVAQSDGAWIIFRDWAGR